MDKEILLMLKRIKTAEPEFIEYLETLTKQNYEAYKRDSAESNDIHKGYAIAIDSLIELFAKCDREVLKTEDPEWM